MARDSVPSADVRTTSRAGRAPLGGAYWRLWGSSGVSNLADGVVKVPLPLVAIQFTRSPTLIAGLTVAMDAAEREADHS